MNAQQERPDVNPGEPRLTCHHRFADGRTGTFRLFRAHTTITWVPELPEQPSDELFAEYHCWYADVLGKVVEHGWPKWRVVKSELVTENNAITAWHVEFDNGVRLEVATPHELLFMASATKDGRDVSTRLNLGWVGEFVQAFILRRSTR